jgi:hypothetical protein
MKRVLTVIFLIAFSSACLAQNQTAWDGFVTDTHCGTNCQRASDMKPDKMCVRLCVRKGSKYGLWYGNRVYELEPQTKLAKFAAENVHVTGTMTNGTIHIQSIALRSQ